MRKKSIKILIALSVFVILIIGVLLCPYFYIKTINVIGNGIVSREEILKAASLSEGNTNLYAFNSFLSEDNLLKNPYIKTVSFSRHFPDTLDITIAERKPCGYIPYTNTFLFMDNEGRILDAKPAYTQPLPVVYGLNFTNFTLGEKLSVSNPDKLQTVVDLSKLMDLYDITEDVIRVDVSNPDNIHLYVNKIDVVIGEFTDVNWKIGALSEIIKKLSPNDKGILDISSPDKIPAFTYLT